MKKMIILGVTCLLFGCVSPNGATSKIPPPNEGALIATGTIINQDRSVYNSGGESAFNWNNITLDGDNVKNISQNLVKDVISGKSNALGDHSSLSIYSFYYILSLSQIGVDCAENTSCTERVLGENSKKILNNKSPNFELKYKEDSKTFKFKHDDPTVIKGHILDLAKILVVSSENKKNKEIEENSKLPETKIFHIDPTRDEYVNKALNIINNERLEIHNTRDYQGNKSTLYGKPTINGKMIFSTPKILTWKISKSMKRCDDVSVYINRDISDRCKDNIINGIKEWVNVSRDSNISDMSWQAAASDAMIGDEISFSHWAGMARVHQKRMNERVDKSYYIHEY